MSDIGDLLFGLLDGLLPESSSDRGHLLLSCVIGLMAVALAVFVLAVSNDPMNEPAWAFGALIWMMLLASGGTASALLHLLWHESENGVASSSLIINALAVALSGYVLMT
jgi:hypothetical protein